MSAIGGHGAAFPGERFDLGARSEIEVKGKGRRTAFFLNGEQATAGVAASAVR